MFHWCIEEQVALLTVIGMIPFLGPWLRAKISKLRGKHCCEPTHRKEE